MSDEAPTFWPLSALELRVADMSLRPMVESDLDTVGALLPEDLEMNPATPRPFRLPEAASRAVALRQEYWAAMGSWSPDAWRLPFVVTVHDHIIGVQTLEADDFAVLRTVDTASWLLAEHRGRGLGKLARTAVLALAFEGLHAEVALTAAWADNAASLGVSRSLGYQPNGSIRHRRGSAGDEMPRLRLDRASWLGASRPSVHVDGLAPCLPWLLAPTERPRTGVVRAIHPGGGDERLLKGPFSRE